MPAKATVDDDRLVVSAGEHGLEMRSVRFGEHLVVDDAWWQSRRPVAIGRMLAFAAIDSRRGHSGTEAPSELSDERAIDRRRRWMVSTRSRTCDGRL